GQRFHLQQRQDKVSVTAGETLTLTCTLSGDVPAGPVKWLKGWGDGNKTVYDQRVPDPRVTRAVNESNTDFTIHIRDAQPEDAGTYYCVKFRKSVRGDELLQHGGGTEVSVRAKPTPPVVSGPGQRWRPKQTVPFTCTAGGFFPENIGVKWLKNTSPLSAPQPQIMSGPTRSSFSMSSTVRVTLQESDVLSQLVCEVQHPTLGETPLRGTYQLRDVLRVAPSVRVVAESPIPTELNKTLNFICHVERFYPREVAVTWLENGTEIKVENTSRLEETSQGLFRLRSLLEVQATEEKNGSMFTCRVVHDAQDPVTATMALLIAAPDKE
ncbi:SHPS1 phosphatase, partial [Trogon melanurus]|nr:SHPS1 phosphatase [Trogon melanurus]